MCSKASLSLVLDRDGISANDVANIVALASENGDIRYDEEIIRLGVANNE